MTTTPEIPPFPLSAIVGQDALHEALLACAVDPAIGGVLVRGERGTAKSTAVRALAPLLPAVEVVAGCAYGVAPGEPCPDGPHTAGTRTRAVRLVELPVGATADRVVGTLDLDRALAEGARAFEPGLLAAAHRGILYVDEVNLLPDHLVDVLLDAAAMGRNHVEREGVSVSHPARFLLVGTMNPEEGELRPQLLDRFGLSVTVAASVEPSERVEVVRRRLAYDADPVAFAAGFVEEERTVATRVAAARARLDGVRLPERMLLLIAGTCARLGVDGLRADIVCARTAKALAALDGLDEVGEEHVRRAAQLVLAHRRRRGPFDPPGLSDDELDDALDRARGDASEDEPEPEPDGPRGGEPAPGDGEAGGDGAPEQRDEGAPAGATASAGDDPRGEGDDGSGARGEERRRGDDDADEREYRAGALAPQRTEAPAQPGVPPLLALAGEGRGARGGRSRAAGPHGASVDSRPAEGVVTDLAIAATLRAAALRGAGGIARGDLREHVRAGREGNLVVFCVDASGSMGAKRRMALVKGAILGLLLDAYQRRDRVALVTFRGAGAQLVLPPTASVEQAAAALADIATGGGTPIAAGLARAAGVVATERRRDADRRSLALVVTDGRASGGKPGRAAAQEAAQRLATTADGVVVFDAEEGAVRLGLAASLAHAAHARLLPLSSLTHAAPQRTAA